MQSAATQVVGPRDLAIKAVGSSNSLQILNINLLVLFNQRLYLIVQVDIREPWYEMRE